ESTRGWTARSRRKERRACLSVRCRRVQTQHVSAEWSSESADCSVSGCMRSLKPGLWAHPLSSHSATPSTRGAQRNPSSSGNGRPVGVVGGIEVRYQVRDDSAYIRRAIRLRFHIDGFMGGNLLDELSTCDVEDADVRLVADAG